VSSTFSVDAEEVAKEILEVARESVSEEDLKLGVEYLLRSKVIERLKEVEKAEIPYASWRPPRARYEVTLVSGLRADALYGHLIIEYEKPRTFDSRSGFEKAVEQVKSYIVAHAEVEARFPRYFGVVLDGYKIGFVRYREAIKGFESKGPFEVNKNTVAKLIEAIIGLRRKALSAEELLKDFGPESSAAREAIKALYNKLLRATPRTEMLFEDWRRVFSQVCAYSPDKIRGLEEVYGFKRGEADPEKLLFALHTYYALIMKLLAAEVASLYVAPKLLSYLRVLEDAYYSGHERLREKLKELEEGGVFTQLKIMNFMEADYFAWYLDEWDKAVADCIMGIVRKLSDYDPSAAELEPERIRDLFKRLYQNLVPKKIRHDLGEYYTPDWLAELVLNEVGWTLETFEKVREEKGDALAPLDLRLLDPACGSGTFLVLAIGRLRQYVEEHWVDKGAALRRITKNIVGFDLNPLAVIASRTNYLIALGDMLREKGDEPIEIPVYLADSVLVERRSTLTVNTYALTTAVGVFEIPTRIIESGLLAKVLKIVEECVKDYSAEEFKRRLVKEVSLEEAEVYTLVKLFEALSNLEREGKNRIWTRVLKNSFAPFFAGKFDYVVGNPPWIAWENLPDDYRNATKDLWGSYGLSLTVGKGAFKKDMAMLFVARCVDRYVKDGGLFSFLIPFTLFKTRAGAGFRKHLTRYNILKVVELVTLYPFEGATNRTSFIVLKKGEKTTFPIPCEIWHNPRSGGIDTKAELNQVRELTKQFKLNLIPIELNKPESPWMQITGKAYEAIKKVIGKSPWYEAHEGVKTALNQVYWIKILEEDSEGYLITNECIPGQKKAVRQIVARVEKDLIYPLIRGRDVKRYYVIGEYGQIIMPHNPSTGKPFLHEEMKVRYPKTWSYLFTFFNELIHRRGAFLKEKLKYYKNEALERAERKTVPFYYVMNTGGYTFSPYKVVWKAIAGAITGKLVDFATAVLEPKGNKPIIPDAGLTLIPLQTAEEAYYVSGVLNSIISRLVIASYSYELGGYTHITQYLRIPKFNSANQIHLRISNFSSKAHQLASRYYDKNDEAAREELKKIEAEIDKLVAQLYGITDEELKEIKKCLAMLEGEEIEEEGEEEVELPPTLPDISLRNNVVGEGKPFDVDVVVSNPFDKPLTNVSAKLKLFDGRLIEKSFEKVEGEVSFSISFDGLKAGEYEIEAVFSYVFENTPKRVEKKLTIYVKGGEVKHVERSFKPEELFGV